MEPVERATISRSEKRAERLAPYAGGIAMKIFLIIMVMVVALSGCATLGHQAGSSIMSGNQYGDSMYLIIPFVILDIIMIIPESDDTEGSYGYDFEEEEEE
jgi:hypothetical protein